MGSFQNITYAFVFGHFLESRVPYLTMTTSIAIFLSFLHHVNISYLELFLTSGLWFFTLDRHSLQASRIGRVKLWFSPPSILVPPLFSYPPWPASSSTYSHHLVPDTLWCLYIPSLWTLFPRVMWFHVDPCSSQWPLNHLPVSESPGTLVEHVGSFALHRATKVHSLKEMHSFNGNSWCTIERDMF